MILTKKIKSSLKIMNRIQSFQGTFVKTRKITFFVIIYIYYFCVIFSSNPPMQLSHSLCDNLKFLNKT